MVDKRGLGGLGRTLHPRPVGTQAPLRPRIGYDEQIFPKPGDYDALKAEEWDMEQEQQLQDWQRPQELGYPDVYEQLISYRPDQVGPYPKTYRNDLPPPPLPQAVMPPGWTPPLSLHQRIERGLEAQRQRRSEPPPARRQEPVLRRKKPKRPKARESEA